MLGAETFGKPRRPLLAGRAVHTHRADARHQGQEGQDEKRICGNQPANKSVTSRRLHLCPQPWLRPRLHISYGNRDLDSLCKKHWISIIRVGERGSHRERGTEANAKPESTRSPKARCSINAQRQALSRNDFELGRRSVRCARCVLLVEKSDSRTNLAHNIGSAARGWSTGGGRGPSWAQLVSTRR